MDPTATNLTQSLSFTEDGVAALFDSIEVMDSDPGDQVAVTLSLDDPGAGWINFVVSGAASVTIDSAEGVWRVVGPVDDVNATLATLGFVPNPNWDQDVVISTQVQAAGGVGSTVGGVITLTATAVNDAPVATVPLSVGVHEDVATSLSGISFSDIEGGTATVTLSVGSGELSGTSTVGVTVGGTPSALTLTGSFSDINTFIAGGGLAYMATTEAGGTETLTVTVADGDGATDTETVTLNITATNDAPEVTAAESIAVAASGSTTISGISFADADAGASSVRVKLSVPEGALSAASGGGVVVSGTASVLTLDGSIADINAFIAGSNVTYVPTSGAARDVMLIASIDDLGNAGSGGAQTDDKGVVLEIAGSTPDPDPEPEPPPPPRTEVVDGVTITIQTGIGPDGLPSRIMDIPTMGPGQTADIPLLTSPGMDLYARLSEGWSLKASGPSSGKKPGEMEPLVRDATSGKWNPKDVSAIMEGLDRVAGVDPERPVLFQNLQATVTGRQTGGPLVIEGSPNEKGDPVAIALDARLQASIDNAAMIVELRNIAFALIKGIAQLIGGEGAQIVFGDGAAQHMVLGEGDDELHGGGGSDVVGSEEGADSLFGDAGDDIVFGGQGQDQLWGGGEADQVQGNQGADFVHGNAGADTLRGGQGDDIVFGGQDNDLAFGDLGNDTVYGDLGDDSITGGEGQDIVHGNQGNDTVQGGAGADFIYGGQGSDRLDGGEGADTLSGDLGDDVLSGGDGADVFLLLANAGVDRVLDFSAVAGDKVRVSAGVTYTLAQEGADAVIDLGSGQRMVLEGVQLTSLPEGWIVGG